jgi:D-alanine-D-alanine ligase
MFHGPVSYRSGLLYSIHRVTDSIGRRLSVKKVVPSECHVALLAGGTSGERDISVASGNGAREALEAAGFSVDMLDPARKQDLVKLIEGDYQVAFLCLHGKMGEDGTIQGLLEILGIPYIGSGVLASALAIDKSKSKPFYEKGGLNVPQSVLLTPDHKASHSELVEKIGTPCVVKPATEGSALGVYIVENEEDLDDAIEKAFEIDTEVIVEKFVSGTEVTVAVIGNDEPEALPIIQIVPSHEFYDFESKYAPGGSKHICPAPLSDEVTERTAAAAITAHKVLGCAGVSRSDFIIDSDGEPWILETNTIPGMTSTSLLPDAARVAGIDFPELCTKLIELAFERKE